MSARSPARCATMRACWPSSPATTPTIRRPARSRCPTTRRCSKAAWRACGSACRCPRRWRRSMPRSAPRCRRRPMRWASWAPTVAPATLPDFTALYRSAEVIVKCEAAAMHRPVDGGRRALRQPGAHAHGGGLLHPGDAVHRRAAPARALRARVPRHGHGRASTPCCCRPSPSPSRPSRRPMSRRRAAPPRSPWWRASPGSRARSTRSACRRCRCPAASTATAADRPAAGRPAVRRGAALPHRPRLPGRDRASQEGAGVVLPDRVCGRPPGCKSFLG